MIKFYQPINQNFIISEFGEKFEFRLSEIRKSYPCFDLPDVQEVSLYEETEEFSIYETVEHRFLYVGSNDHIAFFDSLEMFEECKHLLLE